MQENNNYKNNFFISVWIIFLIILLAYSVYVLIVSPELDLHIKPGKDKVFSYVAFRVIAGIFFFISVFNLIKLKNTKLWLWIIVITGLICRIILIPSQPILEDDFYRYLWDGAVTANIINPYEYSPEQALDNANTEVPQKLHQLADESGNIIKKINHPHIRTIYPILSQLVFAAAYLISPWKYEFWKICLLFFDLLLLMVLLQLLKNLKYPLLLISLYWINPIVLHEFYNAAHMDLLALLFVVLFIFFYTKNKIWIAIVALALAVGFKLWPIILLTLLIRKFFKNKIQLMKYLSVFAAIVFLLFLPVIISGINDSLGFVKYAGKWVNNSAVYTIITWIFEQLISISGVVAGCVSCINRWGIILIYAIISFFILKINPENKIQFLTKAFLLITVLYLISPTQFPWYYTWILPLLVFRPMVSLLLYAMMLPLYQLQYLSGYIVYVEHIPILILFLLELNNKIWKNKFDWNKLPRQNTNSSVLQQ